MRNNMAKKGISQKSQILKKLGLADKIGTVGQISKHIYFICWSHLKS